MSKKTSRPRLLWVDPDAADFAPIDTFAARAGFELYKVPTLLEAHNQLTRSDSLAIKGVILDALVPIGGRRGEELFLQGKPSERADDELWITGHLLFKRVGNVNDQPIKTRTVVLSALDQESLVEAGFPDDAVVFFQKSLLDNDEHWNKFCSKLCEFAGVQMPTGG